MRLCHGLSQNSTLVELDLASNDFTHTKSCEALATLFITNPSKKFPTKSFTALGELNLADCGIGPKQVEELIEGLSRNQTLARLHLDNNELGMRGFRSVRRICRSLHHLLTFSFPLACHLSRLSVSSLYNAVALIRMMLLNLWRHSPTRAASTCWTAVVIPTFNRLKAWPPF